MKKIIDYGYMLINIMSYRIVGCVKMKVVNEWIFNYYFF